MRLQGGWGSMLLRCELLRRFLHNERYIYMPIMHPDRQQPHLRFGIGLLLSLLQPDHEHLRA